MTTTTLATPETCCPPHRPNGIRTLAQGVWASIKRWDRRHRDVRHLQRMSDRELKDIGIRRSDIRAVVYGHAADRIRTLDLG